MLIPPGKESIFLPQSPSKLREKEEVGRGHHTGGSEPQICFPLKSVCLPEAHAVTTSCQVTVFYRDPHSEDVLMGQSFGRALRGHFIS